MSELSEKVLGIKHLPVFPLNIVLAPGEIRPLHIFEPRYRQMLKDIREKRNLFGLSYFDPAESATDRPEIGSIGCVAEVQSVHRMEDGRSNIVTLGIIRYRILGYVDAFEPYLMAEVEFFEDDPEDAAMLEPLADDVFALFKRMIAAAHQLSGETGSLGDLPRAEPQALSFIMVNAFAALEDVKYQLLELTSTSERLLRLREMLRVSVDRIEESAAINKLSQTNGHSKKKIDL